MSEGKKKKSIFKRWWFWAIVVVIFIAIGSSGEDDDNTATDDSGTETSSANKSKAKEDKPAKKKKPAKKAYAIGDEVAVGKLSFTVNDVSEENELTMEYMDSLTTDGKFVIVDVSVKNKDKESRIVDGEMFRIHTADGTEYSATSEADMYVNDGDLGFFLQEINPNLSKSGKVAFEVPADADKYTLQVNSGFGWSGGKYKVINISK